LKKLARQGQSMSSSTLIANIEQKDIKIIKDVGRNGFTFSDGCGFVSPEVMEQVAKIFECQQVSAIQMRYGGFKGVLMMNPALRGQDKPKILFRESMQKFEGNLEELSAIRCSTYSPAFLNRQVILLLSHLGVPEDLILERNDVAISNLNVSETIKKLQRQAIKISEGSQNKGGEEELKQLDKDLLSEIKLFFGPSRQFKKIFIQAMLISNKYKTKAVGVDGKPKQAVFQLDEEPIFCNILHNMVLGQAQILKKKARIRMRDAAVLIGTIDIDC